MRTRVLGTALVATAILSAAGCSGGGAPDAKETARSPLNPESVTGGIKVLTNRTDLVQDGTMKKYAAEFNKTYPKVKVKFEGITDYEGEVKIRMNTKDYGDVLLIPVAVAKADYPKFFAPLDSAANLRQTYHFVDKSDVDGTAYGIATAGNANGLVYNKAVWKKAGVTDWPETAQQFLDDLRSIKKRTDAVPYYTNFKDGWPLTVSAYIGSASCDSGASDKLAVMDKPWGRGNELHRLDTLLYDIVHAGLSEKDPTTTNWETSKTLLAKGEIGTMMLGSWAVNQMRDAAEKAGRNPDDIGFMPFPSKKDGDFCSVMGSDYQQAVNIHSEHKDAARAWIDWFTEKSGYATEQGAVPTLISSPLPPPLDAFADNGVRMVERSEKKTAEVNAIDNAAEIGLNKPDYRQKLVDIARGAQEGTLEGYFDELDKRWSEAMQAVVS